MGKRRILFLCTGNACRSPLAEAWLRHLAPQGYESLSAGSDPAGWVHPLTLRVLREAGLDTLELRPKRVHDFLPPRGRPPDVLVALCPYALSRCPEFPPGVTRVCHPVRDPIGARGSEQERLAVFRGVSDEIRGWIEHALAEGWFEGPPAAAAGPPEPADEGSSRWPGPGPSSFRALTQGEERP